MALSEAKQTPFRSQPYSGVCEDYQAENGIAELLRPELVLRVIAIADPVLRSWTQRFVDEGTVPLIGCEDEKETKRSSEENSG